MNYEILNIILAAIAAVASIITIVQGQRNTKGSIKRRIKKKQHQIHEIENQLYRKFGVNDNGYGRPRTSLDKKKKKLLLEIQELEKEL